MCSSDLSLGFNAQTDTYENLVTAGVIDPTKVVRTALQDAASVAGLLITTEAAVSELPEDKPALPMGGGGMGGMGGGMGGMGGMGGGGMGGMGGGGMGGGGFFSIPPERTLKVPFTSACLNHGKAEPNPTAQYRMVKTSEYTQDAVLAELIEMVGTGRIDQQSAQAAIWTRTDNMSWEQLSTKTVRGIHGFRRYFHPGQIAQGQQLLVKAETRVREQGTEPQAEEPAAGRVR